MRVFVTGASGWVGSAVVPELLAAGHTVTGLACSAAAAAVLTAAGADTYCGSLDDVNALRAGADASDGVIHLAYRHDIAFSGDPAAAAASDLQAIEAIGAALKQSDRPLIVWHTPSSVHFGTADAIDEARQQTLTAAYHVNPARFGRRQRPPARPDQAWINEPQDLAQMN